MSTTPGEKYMFYHYNPSSAAAIAAFALFGLSAIFHAYQLISKRTWYFIPFVIGGLFETVGYVGRFISSRQNYGDWTLLPYIIQSLFILLAPAFFAASIYMVLGRIIGLTQGEKYSLIRARWLTKIFVGGDVLSFLMQAGGGGMMASAKTPSAVHTSELILTGGLIVQVLFFGFFIVTAGFFHFRITRGQGGAGPSASAVPWQQYLSILYVASTFIMIRSIFRIIEYVQGNNGYLLSKEMFIYIFDASLMFLVVIIFNLRHPSAIIHGKKGHEFETSEVPMENAASPAMKNNGGRYGQQSV
ncbi:hypothetical protein NHQ30_003211 [Ciborinia camelliae]|nr:hypothetical protein NHQ30_003211 [Ciborinia camelliae]